MTPSFHTDANETHPSELAVGAPPVEKLNLVLASRLAALLSLVVVITSTPGGVR